MAVGSSFSASNSIQTQKVLNLFVVKSVIDSAPKLDFQAQKRVNDGKISDFTDFTCVVRCCECLLANSKPVGQYSLPRLTRRLPLWRFLAVQMFPIAKSIVLVV